MPSTRAKARALKVALPYLLQAAKSSAVRSEVANLAGSRVAERRGHASLRRLANDKKLRAQVAAAAESAERALGRARRIRRRERRRGFVRMLGLGVTAGAAAWRFAVRNARPSPAPSTIDRRPAAGDQPPTASAPITHRNEG